MIVWTMRILAFTRSVFIWFWYFSSGYILDSSATQRAARQKNVEGETEGERMKKIIKSSRLLLHCTHCNENWVRWCLIRIWIHWKKNLWMNSKACARSRVNRTYRIFKTTTILWWCMKSKVKKEVLCIENTNETQSEREWKKYTLSTRNSVHILHAYVKHVGNLKWISMQIHQNQSRIAILF